MAPATEGAVVAAAESVDLLDGGGQAYPRMLAAIARARRSIHLEVYAFAPKGVRAPWASQRGPPFASVGLNGRVLHLDGWNPSHDPVCDLSNRTHALLTGGTEAASATWGISPKVKP